MKLKEIEKKYKNQWILAKVLKEDKLGQPIELEILAHSKDRAEIYHKLPKTKEKDVATFYAGEIPTKGYAVALNGSVWIPAQQSHHRGFRPDRRQEQNYQTTQDCR